jgi:hypothetical protein
MGKKAGQEMTFSQFCSYQKARIKYRLAGGGFRMRKAMKADRNLDLQRLMTLEDCDELMGFDNLDFEYRRGVVIAKKTI